MGAKNFQEALQNIEMSYSELNEIANDMLQQFFDPINNLVNSITDINNLSTDEVRDFMIAIALKSFSLCEIKEKAALKSELAEALRKERYAREFSAASGTAGAKDTQAILESSNELVAQCLYELVANLLKSKIDHCNRLVDVAKTVIMSRMSEAKLSQNAID